MLGLGAAHRSSKKDGFFKDDTEVRSGDDLVILTSFGLLFN